MGLYNFRERFVPMILDGSKRHTIRDLRAHPDRPGNLCHLYAGLRRPGARLLFRAPCLRIEPIEINTEGITINGEPLSSDEADALAWKDGFRFERTVMELVDPRISEHVGCFQLMISFWVGRLPFSGHIVHWDFPNRCLDGSRAGGMR